MIVASIFAPREDRWGCDYDALLHLLDKSCKKLGLRHVVISDAERPGLETAVFDLPDNLMRLIIDGQRQFLHSAFAVEPVLFVGADCLITKDPRPVLKGDLTVTIGPFQDCEMNTGAIWCVDGDTCWPVWETAMEGKLDAWGDDQRALYEVVKKAEEGDDIVVSRVRCEDHNWAPRNAADPITPTVAHFRGDRKAFMAEWARNHLGIE